MKALCIYMFIINNLITFASNFRKYAGFLEQSVEFISENSVCPVTLTLDLFPFVDFFPFLVVFRSFFINGGNGK